MNDQFAETVERVIRIATLVLGAASTFIGGIIWGLRRQRANTKKEEADANTAVVITEKTQAEVRQMDANTQKTKADITLQAADRLLLLVNELQEELKDVRQTLFDERRQRVTEHTNMTKDIQDLRTRVSASEYKNDHFQRGIKILIGQLHDNGLTPLWTPSNEEHT